MAIFKIKSNIFDEKISEICLKLTKNYSALFFGDTLYISPNHFDQSLDFKKFLVPKKSFLVSEMTDEDIAAENDVVKNWCKEKMVQLDIQRFEKEKQNYLKDLMEYLDNLDSLLERGVQEGVD